MTSHIYFDFFGTLVDFLPSVHPSARNAPYEFAVRAGVPIAAPEASALWQRAWDELDGEAARTGRECSLAQIAARYAQLVGVPGAGAESLERLTREYLAAWTRDVSLPATVAGTLEDLAGDHTLAVVSNAHDPGLVEAQLERFGLTRFFADVFVSVDLGWRKPHPEIFRQVLAHHGIPAAEAVFVGDTWEADVVGPRAAGMAALYVGLPRPGREPVAFADLPRVIRRGVAVPGGGFPSTLP